MGGSFRLFISLSRRSAPRMGLLPPAPLLRAVHGCRAFWEPPADRPMGGPPRRLLWAWRGVTGSACSTLAARLPWAQITCGAGQKGEDGAPRSTRCIRSGKQGWTVGQERDKPTDVSASTSVLQHVQGPAHPSASITGLLCLHSPATDPEPLSFLCSAGAATVPWPCPRVVGSLLWRCL